MVIDWLAAGLNPAVCTMFVQSRVPEHAELHLLLSMITPLGWLERVPTYKDQQEQLKEKDLATYGFLGYPLLQSADILLYRPMGVPVGEDQVAHVEITREIARRFNFVFGREPDFEAKAERAIKNLGSKNAAIYRDLRKSYQEQGNADALDQGARAARRQFAADARRPRAPARLPRRHRPHDPARARRAADGDAEGHRASTAARCRSRTATRSACARIRTQSRRSSRRCRPIRRACAAPIRAIRRNARSGTCTSCIRATRRSAGPRTAAARPASVASNARNPLIDRIVEEITGMRQRAQEYEDNPDLVRGIIAEGCEKARAVAGADARRRQAGDGPDVPLRPGAHA